VSRKALLVKESDHAFRELITNLHVMAQQLIELRAHMARELGVTGPQFSLLLAVAHAQSEEGLEDGINVTRLARQLRVTPAFVTTEAGKLIRQRFLAKRGSMVDRRGVLLSVTERGHARLMAYAPKQQKVNDEIFRSLDARTFRNLTLTVKGLVEGGERALRATEKKN
jgi:DNA-binding MarR family transcriptional regulator